MNRVDQAFSHFPWLPGPGQPQITPPMNRANPATMGSRFQQFLASPAALAMAAGLVGGRTPREQMGGALGMAAQARADQQAFNREQAVHNATAAWLDKMGRPDLANMARAGAGQAAMQIYAADRREPEKPSAFREQWDFYRQANPDADPNEFFKMYKSGGPTINVGEGPKQVGDYIMVPDEGNQSGYRMDVIPGSETWREQQSGAEAEQAGRGSRETASDVVVMAAARARAAAADRNFGAAGTSVVGMLPWTDSAEVMRQTSVLKSLASAEALNAMRRQSKTGGALGNVTERELRLLSEQAGALDPNSPNFERDLADYERALLRTIHGREAGDAIFKQTRQIGNQGSRQRLDALKKKYGLK